MIHVTKPVTGLIILISCAVSSGLSAKVGVQEAALLGHELTPLGAQQPGNADGSIPAWEGGISNASLGKNIGENEPVTHPFPNDKPLFTITSSNMQEYQDYLTPGQQAMFAKYPDSYTMPVYTTRRTLAQSAMIYAQAKLNATNTTLTQQGDGLDNFALAVPFPIPKNGLEVIWNHITRYRGSKVARTKLTMSVHVNGNYTAVKSKEKFFMPEAFAGGRDNQKEANTFFYYLNDIVAPASLSGWAILVHETYNQVQAPRQIWVYDPSLRRVLRLPNIAYDDDGIAADGLRTVDNYDMYNGSPDRYNWELVGKTELYIPYNAYNLAAPTLRYRDIVKPGHLNQVHTRYEKHRVWEVRATVKAGQKHQYAQRHFFIDEDSWQAAVIDHYDSKLKLWRVAEAHAIQYYNADVNWFAAETLYDLQNGRYLVNGLNNEEKNPIQFAISATRNDFSIAALNRLGK